MISSGCIALTILRLRQMAKQPVGSLAGLRGCADDGAVVFAQHLKLSAAARNVKESGHNALNPLDRTLADVICSA